MGTDSMIRVLRQRYARSPEHITVAGIMGMRLSDLTNRGTGNMKIEVEMNGCFHYTAPQELDLHHLDV